MATTYMHELAEWPRFEWDAGRLAAPLATARHLQGRLLGQMEALGFKIQEEALLRTLTEDVLKSSEIEGERLDAARSAPRSPRSRNGHRWLKARTGRIEGVSR